MRWLVASLYWHIRVLSEKEEEDGDDDKLTYTAKQGEYCEYSGPTTCNAHHAAFSPPDVMMISEQGLFCCFYLFWVLLFCFDLIGFGMVWFGSIILVPQSDLFGFFCLEALVCFM